MSSKKLKKDNKKIIGKKSFMVQSLTLFDKTLDKWLERNGVVASKEILFYCDPKVINRYV